MASTDSTKPAATTGTGAPATDAGVTSDAGNAGNAGNTAMPVTEHDRVVTLTLNADGTPRQLNPELIGDPEQALAFTQEQYRQQAVSAVDVIERQPAGAVTLVGQEDGSVTEEPLRTDSASPAIDELKGKHDAAADAAADAAKATVEALTPKSE